LWPHLAQQQAVVAASHHRINGDNQGTTATCLCSLICRWEGGGGADNNDNLTPLSTSTRSITRAVYDNKDDDDNATMTTMPSVAATILFGAPSNNQQATGANE
jgi:hypothetical protein